ncbi:hypothetical protein [Streptomyces marianii]|uniref:Uncharacterized protein n=1 Tax=Streptomyces marianii TaxID=1817406 RepID=A0A5R9DUF7_9ACTN|nr:hypothetical protein [Streptomyces marianii]TLQ39421.1 hypothetical protein FEF34_39270 [Streptomyces marianii]
MIVAMLDVLLTILLPLVMGAAITCTSPSGVLFTRPPEQPLVGRGRLAPMRVLLLLLPVVWQPLASRYLLAERLFGVFVIAVIGMGLGRVGRAVARRLPGTRSGS